MERQQALKSHSRACMAPQMPDPVLAQPADDFEEGWRGGGDHRFVRDFLRSDFALADPMESHCMGCRAEESRHKCFEAMKL